MPARIRFQLKGTRANPFYWIIAHSSKMGPRAVPIERLGYWIPDNKRVYEDRSIILNRPRLKYWLGVGAEPTKGVQKLLGKIGFLPKRPPPFGSASLYPRPETTQPEPIVQLRDLGAANHLREKVEEMNKAREERKLQYEDNAHRQFHIRGSEPPEEKIKEYIEKYYSYLEKLKEVIPNTQEGKVEAFIRVIGLIEDNSKVYEPRELAAELKISEQAAENILDSYRSIQILFTQADVDDMKADLSRKPRKLTEDTPFVIPPEIPMTPVPDLYADEKAELPLKLFGIKHPVRPNKDYGIKILPRPEFKQAKTKEALDAYLKGRS